MEHDILQSELDAMNAACEHGRQQRKCENCELNAANARIAALEAENERLRNENDQIREVQSMERDGALARAHAAESALAVAQSAIDEANSCDAGKEEIARLDLIATTVCRAENAEKALAAKTEECERLKIELDAMCENFDAASKFADGKKRELAALRASADDAGCPHWKANDYVHDSETAWRCDKDLGKEGK